MEYLCNRDVVDDLQWMCDVQLDGLRRPDVVYLSGNIIIRHLRHITEGVWFD